MANPAEKIFDHMWLDPVCIESGCQSLLLGQECNTRAAAQVYLADFLAAAKHEASKLRKALEQIRIVCDDNVSDTCDKSLALKFVRDVADKALGS
jgi:hypothetical protein